MKELGGRNFIAVVARCFSRCRQNSESLIIGMSNNAAEQLNSYVCKNNCGKRLSFDFGRSFQGRCACAVIHFNTSESWISHFWKWRTGFDPPKRIVELEKERSNGVSISSNYYFRIRVASLGFRQNKASPD